MCRTFFNDEIAKIAFRARQILAATAGSSLPEGRRAIEILLEWTPVNTLASRRQIAEYLLA
jgi:hypothetical protein